MTDVAAKFWDTKQVSSLAPLQSVLMTATNRNRGKTPGRPVFQAG